MTTTGTRFSIYPAAGRGQTRFRWLDGRHSFSFGRFHDPERMGFRSLRVINDDRVAPSGGFPEHPHENMEIVTYILSGALAHKDSLGSGSTIRPGDIQRMSAGTGILHSEFNPSDTEPTRLLQIWLHPEKRGLEPSYEEKTTGVHDRKGELLTIVSPEGGPNAVRIHQDAVIEAGVFGAGQSVERSFGADRYGWIQVARGDFELTVAGETARIGEGDGVALAPGATMRLEALGEAEVLVFDLD